MPVTGGLAANLTPPEPQSPSASTAGTAPCWCLWSGRKVWLVSDWALGVRAFICHECCKPFKTPSNIQMNVWIQILFLTPNLNHRLWLLNTFFDKWCILLKLMETERSRPGCAPRITTKPLTIHFSTLKKLPTEKRMLPRRALCSEYLTLWSMELWSVAAIPMSIWCVFQKHPDRLLFCSAHLDAAGGGDYH